MSKKIIYGVLATIILGVIGGGGFYLIKSQSDSSTEKNSLFPSLSTPKLGDKQSVTADLTYEDSSGFSFKHPKAVTVKDTTPDDDKFYSVVSVTKGSEILTLSVEDTKYKTVEEWLAKDLNAPKGAKLQGATTLGGFSAKQYSDNTSLYTVTIDEGVLYFLKGPAGDDFWEATHEVIVDTFAIAGSEKNSASSQSAPQEVEYEEEEIVE